MRAAVLLAVALAMLMAAPTLAKSDKASPSAPGQTKGAEKSASGMGAGSGETKSHSARPDGSTPIGSDADSEQNDALDAVESGEALPLSTITAAAVAKWGGKAIDAKLILVRGQRVYRLTLLSDDGVSRHVYYSARTGQPMQVN